MRRAVFIGAVFLSIAALCAPADASPAGVGLGSGDGGVYPAALEVAGEGDITAAALAEEQARSLDTGRVDALLDELNRDTAPFLAPLNRDTIFRFLRGADNPWQLGDLARGLARYFFSEVAGSLGLLGKLVVLAVLAAVLFNLQASLNEAGVARAAYAAVLLALVGLALTSFHLGLQAGQGAVERLVSFMQSILPVLIAMLVASGSVVSAGLLHPFVLMAVHLGSLLVLKWVLPLVFLAAVVEVVTSLSENVKLSGMARLLRQGGLLALGLGFILFLGAMTVYGAAGSVSDGVTLRTAKFLAKSFIPVVGGMFADAAELVASSSILLRNGIGLLGLIGVSIMVVLPLLKLLSLVFIYRLAAAAVQPIAGPGIVSCLDGLAGSLLLVCVAVGAVAVMFFLAIAVLVGAGNAAVMFR